MFTSDGKGLKARHGARPNKMVTNHRPVSAQTIRYSAYTVGNYLSKQTPRFHTLMYTCQACMVRSIWLGVSSDDTVVHPYRGLPRLCVLSSTGLPFPRCLVCSRFLEDFPSGTCVTIPATRAKETHARIATTCLIHNFVPLTRSLYTRTLVCVFFSRIDCFTVSSL